MDSLVGGTGSMVLWCAVAAGVFGLLAMVVRRWLGWISALAWAGLFWWLTVIAAVTLIPLTGIDLELPAEAAQATCSTDIGGPAPDGFWIFDGAQRTLNTVLFVPVGALLVLAVSRWRGGWLLAPLGLGALAAYSVGIEWTQLELARIGRACDLTDVIDNATGAVIGAGIGVVLMLVLRPWRHKHEVRRARAAAAETARAAGL